MGARCYVVLLMQLVSSVNAEDCHKMHREGLGARISSGLIGFTMESWKGCCVHCGMVMVAGCVNTVV